MIILTAIETYILKNQKRGDYYPNKPWGTFNIFLRVYIVLDILLTLLRGFGLQYFTILQLHN